ncbi:MAG: DUF3150 domain-containing protein [Candidatus Competibacteraceae bacterium]|nr:DUF3150 domain-containing protein [Candidatus Competibacteraceae bacterium]MCB1803736.1 DUF3150 domain-containing protein [Candidatus Competibacteraceae bacterium]MCB1810167.1 DUF3150 domain-containing protein [Candidatus Competibacteraceae bacterium]
MQTQSLDVIADQIVFVNLDITNWSGKKTLTPEDLGLARAQLPPETLVSLGDKQLIDPAALREFSTLRSAARRYCLAVGTRFMGGYIVPVSKAHDLFAKLSALEQQYRDKRTAFLARFDALVSNWTGQQPPEWQRLIREALVPSTYVGERLSFAVQAVRLGTPTPEVVVHHGLDNAVNGLSAQLFHEVALIARETLEKSFQGKTEVTRRALSPFRAMREKLDGLSFIDSCIRFIVQTIDCLLADIAARQAITGPILQRLVAFLVKASQPAKLRAYAESLAVSSICTSVVSGAAVVAQGTTPSLAPIATDDPVPVLLDTGRTLRVSCEVGSSLDEALLDEDSASSEHDEGGFEPPPSSAQDEAEIECNGQAVIVPASRDEPAADIVDDDKAAAAAVTTAAADEGESWFFN